MRMPVVVRSLSALAMAVFASAVFASVHASSAPSDGWQMLTASAPDGASQATQADAPASASASASTSSRSEAQTTDATHVASVVLAGDSSAPAGTLTFSVTQRDLNLRNALDRWLQQLGWQLAWSVSDDLPIEFNATFTGNFTSVLDQVMSATNHMHTPTRVCRYTNNVIRVIARAANCQD